MASEQLTNPPSTPITLGADCTSGATTITTSATCPVSENTRILIGSELLLVTGGTGSTTWNVTRGIEGTTAAAHSNGNPIIFLATAGGISQFVSDKIVAETSLYARRIDQVSLGSAQSTITFSSIDQSFSSLMLVISGRSSDGATLDDFYMQVNSDTGSNYDRQYQFGSDTSNTANKQSAVNNAVIGTMVADGAASNWAGSVTVSFPDYAGTTFYKTAISVGGMYDNIKPYVVHVWWNWRSTAAISSIVLKLISGANFKAGTKATLYGLP